ncbi:zinc finger protein Eos isoform X2 [Labrus bergylta]|uniref:zinc finger protein Eos isoform X2 n=1 Tax=Labrus bergylta TaxID=56723 RepID=UPI0009B34A2E|nr:zinc finger protein Eos-like isoform X2 [Labrus bergylta]
MASGDRMNADDCNGCPFAQGNEGESSTEQDFYGGLQGPSARSPNSQQSSPHRSLSANSIKVELCGDDESPGAPQAENREAVGDESGRDDSGDPMEEGGTEYAAAEGDGASVYNEIVSPDPAGQCCVKSGWIPPGPIRLPNGKLQCEVCGMICIGPNVLMVHKRSHTGERPFQCNQCGASFTQKGNLLRHIKLHSGEKPFKCPVCNYACRRRDALAGHLRTHAVGKPFKCTFCSRSYKQQSTLEEHLERCHSYLNSLDHKAANNTLIAHGEESVKMEAKPVLKPSNDKIQFVDRLAVSITKRKRSTPQKFLGEKQMHLDLPEAPYELSSGSEKEGDLMSSQSAGDPSELAGSHLQGSRVKGETSDPPALSHLHPAFLSEYRTVTGSINSNVALHGSRAHGGGGPAAVMPFEVAGEGRGNQPSAHSHTTSPNGCPDSTDTESTAEEQSTRATAPTSTSNNHHLHYQTPALPRSHPNSSPSKAKDLDTDWERARPVPTAMGKRGSGSHLSSRETVQVLDRDGRPVRSFHCHYCRILFLDHVMFTIHMGCHGFRQPFECNICGHRSQDRYEFSSHISRGEHQVG